MKGGTVADTDETTDPAEDAPSIDELEQRVSGVESKLDLILDKLGGTRDQAHVAAQEHTEDRLDRPSSIAEQIRAQLEETRAREAAEADKRSSADRLASLEERLSGMAEKPPEDPLRPVTRLMWGSR